MRKILLAGLMAASLTACAGRPFTATTYRPQGLLGGYSEKEIEPGIWKVTGNSNGIAEMGFGRNMAAYRAAELMASKGFTHVQILDQKGSARSVGYGGGSMSHAGETMVLTVRGANSPASPTDCRAKNPSACITVEAASVMASLGPQLHIGEGKAPAQ